MIDVEMKLNKLSKKYLSAFSLLEMSVLLLIVGLMVVAVIGGKGLVSGTNLATARSLTRSSPVRSIEDLIIWLETTSKDSFSDDQRVNGAAVANWYDINPQLSYTADVSQSTSTAQPSYNQEGINGLPTLSFDGSDYLEGDFIVTGDEVTAFIVTKRSEAAADSVTGILVAYNSANTYDNESSGSFKFSELSSGAVVAVFRSNDTGLITHPGNDIPYILATTYDGTDNISYFNGTVFGDISSSGNFDINKLLVGAGYFNNNYRYFYNGDIGEIIIYDRTLSAFERELIEEYLSQKWKIDLD